jgi:nucleotide-binding universal stress UspA family protein
LVCSLARDHGSRVLVLHVKPPPETMMGEFGMPPPELELDDDVQHHLARLQSMASVPVECEMCDGEPAEAIVALARRTPCDLIVMSADPHTALGRLFLGSVSEEVATNAPCTVLIVRTPEAVLRATAGANAAHAAAQ